MDAWGLERGGDVGNSNWGASAMLLVAAILAFSLVHPWGKSIPRWLLLVMGWTACILPSMHAVYGYVTKGLLLAGIIRLEFFDFSAWATVNVEYLILTDLLLFEPWFLIAGILFGLATLHYQSDIMKRYDNKIGHFTSKEGKEDFQIAYDESMALLPKPNETKDIKRNMAQFVLITLLKRKTNIKIQYSYSLAVVHLLQCGYLI